MTHPTLDRLRQLDGATWRTATWWSPVMIQVVFAVLWGLGWLLAKWPFDPETRFRTLILTPTVITTAVSLLIGHASLSASSPRCRGIGLAIAGSALALLAMMLIYTLGVLPWLDPRA